MNLIPANLMQKNAAPARRRGFTLIELLIVITIIGVLAAFIVGAVGAVKKNKAVSATKAELAQIETALENYKAKYGVYPPANQRPPANYVAPSDRAQLSQLYYELSGTIHTNIAGVDAFVTLDGAYTILAANVQLAYGVGGLINCTKGVGEDVAKAQNFLPSLNPKQYYYPITNSGSGTPIPTTALVASVGGPDDNYLPFGLNSTGLNPIRYVYPGTNNPTGYDLWVQLVISGKTNLVCNWTKSVLVNTAYP